MCDERKNKRDGARMRIKRKPIQRTKGEGKLAWNLNVRVRRAAKM